jgi:hypothetical protein
VVIEQSDPLLDERQIEVEISGLRACIGSRYYPRPSFSKKACHVGVHGAKILELYIGRVADNGVKTAALEHRRKGVLLIEGIHTLLLGLVVKR